MLLAPGRGKRCCKLKLHMTHMTEHVWSDIFLTCSACDHNETGIGGASSAQSGRHGGQKAVHA